MLTQPERLKKELTDQDPGKWGYLGVSLNVCCLTGEQDRSITQAQGSLYCGTLEMADPGTAERSLVMLRLCTFSSMHAGSRKQSHCHSDGAF